MLGPAQEALDDPRAKQRCLFNNEAHVAFIHGAQKQQPHNYNNAQQRKPHSDPCIMFKFRMSESQCR